MSDVGILMGARAILSLIGLTTIFAGIWIRERRWDDQGEQAYDKYIATVDGNYTGMEGGQKVVPQQQQQQQPEHTENLGEPYQAMSDKAKNFHDDGSRDIIQISSSDAEDRLPLPRSLQRDLEALFPFPIVLTLGCVLLMISLMLTPDSGDGYNNGWNLTAIFLIPISVAIYITGIPKATLERTPDLKPRTYYGASGIFILMCIIGMVDGEVHAPWFFLTVAAIFVPLSFYVLHKTRKMGAVWDETARANKDCSFNNGFFYFLVVGLYCLWVGFNAVYIEDGYQGGAYMPIETGLRGWFAAIAGMGLIVPAGIFMEYAFEKDSEVTGDGLSGDAITKLMSGISFIDMEPLARVLETPFVAILGWMMLAFTLYLPFEVFNLKIFFASILGASAGLFYNLMVLPTYWTGNLQDHNKFVYVYSFFMMAFAIVLGLNSVPTMVMSVLGAVMILLGQFLDLLEQKKGRFWLQERIDNPTLSLFGIGQPLLVFGWILVCHAVALPIVDASSGF